MRRNTFSALLLAIVGAALWMVSRTSVMDSRGTEGTVRPPATSLAARVPVTSPSSSTPAPEALDDASHTFYSSRRAHLYARMATDPEGAYVEMDANRSHLPASELVESPVTLQGSLSVTIGCGDAGTPTVITRTLTTAEGEHYEIHTWDAGLRILTTPSVTLEGYRIDRRVVAHPDSLMALGSPSDGDPAPSTAALQPQGTKRILYIPARYSDDTSDPTDATLPEELKRVADHFAASSYGKLELSFTLTGTVTLPGTSRSSRYRWKAPAFLSNLVNDAAAAALKLNPDWNGANFDCVFVATTRKNTSWNGYAGVAEMGGRRGAIVANRMATIGHELGHALGGLYHANRWRATGLAPYGPGRLEEYGHGFSLMSNRADPTFSATYFPQFAATEKKALGWLTEEDIGKVTESGTYRLYALDASFSGLRALRLERPVGSTAGGLRKLWLNFRSLCFDAPVDPTANSLQVDWCTDIYGNLSMAANMLSMGPGTTGIPLGFTFSDRLAGIHITPVALDPAGKYIDARIELDPTEVANPVATLTASKSVVAVNEPVTLTVAANSNIPLYYHWSPQLGPTDTPPEPAVDHTLRGSTSLTLSWKTPGYYVVTAHVSDGRGGHVYKKVMITVGSDIQAGYITGRLLVGGQPISGARVTAAGSGQLAPGLPSTAAVYTDSEGTFNTGSLAPILRFGVFSTAYYKVTPLADAPTGFAQAFYPVRSGLRPVSRGTNTFGVDYHGKRPGPLAYTVAGKVTDTFTSPNGLEVRLGGNVARCDSAGNFRFTNVLPGTYRLSVNSAFEFAGPEEVTVENGNVAGVTFARVTYPVTGTIRGFTSGIPIITVSGGAARGTLAWVGGVCTYRILVPAGTWIVGATLSKHTVTCNGSNRVTVSSEFTPPIDFTATPGAVGAIAGRITDGLTGLSGATVTAGGRSAVTDTLGYYIIPNLVAKTYSVTATKEGVEFRTPTISLRVSSGSTAKGNFTVKVPTANPSWVKRPSATAVTGLVPSTLTASAKGSQDDRLTYTWDCLSGPGPVSFGINNGTNAAQQCTASFTAFGVHTLRCTVRDPRGTSLTANVVLTVYPSPVSMISMSPFEASVPAGQTVSFLAFRWDQAGQPFAVSPVWSTAAPNMVSPIGIFTGNQPGTIPVTATYGLESARVFISVQ